MNPGRMARTALAALSLLGAAGCCSTFDADWEKTPASSGEGLPGCWSGSWKSDGGHEGGLRCIMTPTGAGFDARYHATYDWCIFGFSFEYTVPVTAEKNGVIWTFKGGAELSCWIGGGSYTYEGRIDGADFTATYQSENDRGVFKMKRVK